MVGAGFGFGFGFGLGLGSGSGLWFEFGAGSGLGVVGVGLTPAALLVWSPVQSSSASHHLRLSCEASSCMKPLWYLQPHRAVKSTPARGGMKIMLAACAPCTLISRSVQARRCA